MHAWQLLLQEEGRFTTSRNAEPCEYRAMKPSVRSTARLEAGNSAFQSPGTSSAPTSPGSRGVWHRVPGEMGQSVGREGGVLSRQGAGLD